MGAGPLYSVFLATAIGLSAAPLQGSAFADTPHAVYRSAQKKEGDKATIVVDNTKTKMKFDGEIGPTLENGPRGAIHFVQWDPDQSFARVIQCQNDVGRAELYLPGSAMTQQGRLELRLGDKIVNGYLAFDFTPVGKNKTMEGVHVRMANNGGALAIELWERGQRATIPLAGGKVVFPQRLAEEMDCKPFNTN